MLQTVAVHGYRSLRELRLPLGRVTLITGGNGTGKSSVYRALRLLADCASGRVIGSLAREGGLGSTLWAGPETIGARVRGGEFPVQGTTRGGPVSLQLGFAGDDLSYLIDLGLPIPAGSAFDRDPEIKRELVWTGPRLRPASTLARRRNRLLELRDERGGWQPYEAELRTYESIFGFTDAARAPELLTLRELIGGWRFYDHFRADGAAPARQPQVGTRTPVLHHDGRDLAAALQTIIEIGAVGQLRETIADAFPGSELGVRVTDGRFEVELRAHGLLRRLTAAELSDGTLRYLLLVAALLSPRPPGLLVLNEPETSLHVELLAPLARLIAAASEHSQIVVVSHAGPLLATLQSETGAERLELVKDHGETRVAGRGAFDGPAWDWGSR